MNLKHLLYVTIFFVAIIELSSSTDSNLFDANVCKENHSFQTKFRPKIQQLKNDVQQIIDYVMNNEKGKTYKQLAEFVDRFGPRMTGTKTLEDSIDYMINLLQRESHDNVHGEQVLVPRWIRGNEWARMIKPRDKKLNILGLGYSEGTNGQTIEAPIIVVRNFTELEQKSQQINGKIVVYNFHFESYGKKAIYRRSGASRAAKYGAVAAMIRSLTPFSIDSPHTGMQSYDANVTRIPAISITTEDADLFQRFSDRNEEVIVRIYSENHNEKDKSISRNTVSEFRGEKYPNEIVLVSGHIDSWDVGQGAMDDGAGAFISWRTISILKKLNLKPKRTLRSILWTAEEFGLIGVYDYVKKHKNDLNNFVIAMESDIGTFTPIGITYSGSNTTSQCTLWEILQLMQPINATTLTISDEGSDVQAFYENGVPIGSLDTKNEKYFYFHHTQGDTMTVEQSDDLDKCQALWTSVSYALSMLDDPLPR